MKKNRGFTLIELLAVIVILAIIALIAVPVIMNIINKANESAFKDTAYGIISAGELYFAERQLEPNGMLEDVTITLPDTTKTLQLKGEVPTGTILITKEGKVAIAVHNNRYCVTKGIEDKDVKVTEDIANCKLLDPNSLTALATTSTEVPTKPACLNDGTECASGTPVAIKVNASEVYNFYVIDETDNEITLIMDRNIGTQVAWYKDDDDSTNNELNNLGPITVLNYLNSEISDWTNIPVISSYEYINNENGTTNTYGYQKLEITNGIGKLTSQDGATTTTLSGTSRARLLTESEVNDIKTANNNTTPTWLYTNLSSSNTTEQPYGYWFLTAYPSNSNIGRWMYYDGNIRNRVVSFETINGARPVITLSK